MQTGRTQFAELPLDSIRPRPNQPRTEFDEDALERLAGSIRDLGVLQPVLVARVEDGEGEYELVAGERRWRAARIAGLSTMPAMIKTTSDADALRALAENIHREDLNPLEEAVAYRSLLDDTGISQAQLADRLQVSRARISHAIGMLRLPDDVQAKVAAKVLSFGHARALCGVSDPAQCSLLARRAIAEGMTVRTLEELVALEGDAGGRAPRKRTVAAPNAYVADFTDRLVDSLDTRVKIVGGRRGRIVVEFAGDDDLARLVDLISPRRRVFGS